MYTTRSIINASGRALNKRQATSSALKSLNNKSYSTISFSNVTSIPSQVNEIEGKINKEPLIERIVTSNSSLSFGQTKKYEKSIKLSENKSIVLVKIGGGVIENDMNALIQSLNFLKKIGLFPIVVHGGGPQLNVELAAANLPAEYVEGLRVTPPAVLAVAQRVFARENLKIVDALEASGTRARPITQGVYQASPLDPKTYGFVGAVDKILTDALANCIAGDYVPVVSSLAMTEHGQVLNINADVAALELAKAVRPLKIVFVNTTAGMKDGDGRVMPHIVLDEQYDELMKQSWVKHGTKLKLKEFKSCLDNLPLSTSITITSPLLLRTELFSRNGSGTTVEKGNSLLDSSQSQFCYRTFGAMIGTRDHPANIKKVVQDAKVEIFVNSSYSTGLAIKDSSSGSAVKIVDKFFISKDNITDESADSVFRSTLAKHPRLIWTTATAEQGKEAELVQTWFKKVATGFISVKGVTTYWTNMEIDEVQKHITQSATNKSALDKLGNESTLNVASEKKDKYRIGLLGARGFTGGHLVRLISQHAGLELALAASSTNYGKPITTEFPTLKSSLLFSQVTPDNIAKYTVDNGIDGWFMALPDKISSPYVAALDVLEKQPTLVDLSSDHRFDNSWVYGSPETNRAAIRKGRRIANPGCYATGMYLSLKPLVKAGLLNGTPSCFGISGYSGAGSKPSDKNDTKRLADNIIPYKLVDHTHEREVSHQLGHPIYFMPHVGQFFQGITLTISTKLNRSVTVEEITELYKKSYADEPLVKIDAGIIPEVKTNQNKHTLTIGGFTIKDNHLVIVTTLDNLLKGAATQALQNMNLSLNLNELDGIKSEL
ncbi:acetylglutamate kinase [Cavenderia fasciculata]|uniref:acetylglutamate kinase n=1 Tax=Cavenderia fasciculata TaxID=261658 RepID=F4PLY6_CACFS|nr:acetylglutamate kinase [Cavenderia fasciculata]EGG23540.1 acetylglutamate kinase [Cavenderia fasciculata]|eukprot:XP_004361391.1 acetylglutamate kinase [Cavenderia fasciculata]